MISQYGLYERRSMCVSVGTSESVCVICLVRDILHRDWQYNPKCKSRDTNREKPSCPLWIAAIDDLFVGLQITQVSPRG